MNFCELCDRPMTEDRALCWKCRRSSRNGEKIVGGAVIGGLVAGPVGIAIGGILGGLLGEKDED